MVTLCTANKKQRANDFFKVTSVSSLCRCCTGLITTGDVLVCWFSAQYIYDVVKRDVTSANHEASSCHGT